MDSDGEDDPDKIINILNLLEQNPESKLITLNRTIRKESFFFLVFYMKFIYFFYFYLLLII